MTAFVLAIDCGSFGNITELVLAIWIHWFWQYDCVTFSNTTAVVLAICICFGNMTELVLPAGPLLWQYDYCIVSAPLLLQGYISRFGSWYRTCADYVTDVYGQIIPSFFSNNWNYYHDCVWWRALPLFFMNPPQFSLVTTEVHISTATTGLWCWDFSL
jgi:hypothetical protein